MNATRVLALDEVRAVLKDLRRRARRSPNKRLDLAIFRLSCCCGLRRKEIAGLEIADLTLTGPRPCLRVRKAITKGRAGKRRGRIVPLWWDAGTLADLSAWIEFRRTQGASPKDLVVCGQSKQNFGKPLSGACLAKRWTTAIKCLGPARAHQLSIHTGRHTFCTLSLAAGRSGVEVRDAAGHANISMTSLYLHLVERPAVPDIFS